jgi:hypothetical protein
MDLERWVEAISGRLIEGGRGSELGGDRNEKNFVTGG